MKLRPVEDIQRAHDVLWSQRTGETPAVFCPDDMEKLAVALDVLCWVLNHQHADGFPRVLAEVEAEIDRQGYAFHRADRPFVGPPGTRPDSEE